MLVLILAAIVAVFDQATKQWVRGSFALHEGVTVFGGCFDLRYVQNTGAAFGMLEGRNWWLVVLSAVVLALLVRYWRALLGRARIQHAAVGLMVGGVAGNLFDRVRYGYVVDFLDFYWGRHHFPAFNVADSAICAGVAIYIVLSLTEAARDRKDKAVEKAAGS